MPAAMDGDRGGWGFEHYEAVRALIAANVQLMDAGEFERWADLYTAAGRHIRNGVASIGRQALLDFIESAYPPQVRGVHLCGPTSIGVTGEHVVTTTPYVFVGVVDAKFQIRTIGTYRDTFVDDDGVLRFAERDVTSRTPADV